MHITEEYRYGTGITLRKLTLGSPSLETLAVTSLFVAVSGLSAAVALVGMVELPLVLLVSYLAITALGGGWLYSHLRVIRPPSVKRRFGEFPNAGPWIAELDHYPDAPSGEYHREFVTTGGDSRKDAIATLCDAHDIDEQQIRHLRNHEPVESTPHPDITLTGSPVWFDDRDDPVKGYSVQQYWDGVSTCVSGDDWGPTYIHHSIAGLSANGCVRHDLRTYSEMVAHLEIHELCHWALRDDEQPEQHEEAGWDDAIWNAMDHAQENQPDGPWFREERRARIEATRTMPAQRGDDVLD